MASNQAVRSNRHHLTIGEWALVLFAAVPSLPGPVVLFIVVVNAWVIRINGGHYHSNWGRTLVNAINHNFAWVNYLPFVAPLFHLFALVVVLIGSGFPVSSRIKVALWLIVLGGVAAWFAGWLLIW